MHLVSEELDITPSFKTPEYTENTMEASTM